VLTVLTARRGQALQTSPADPLRHRAVPLARASEMSALRIDNRRRADAVTLIGYVKTEDTLICGRFLLCCGDDRRR
jgi:hypothetical protein